VVDLVGQQQGSENGGFKKKEEGKGPSRSFKRRDSPKLGVTQGKRGKPFGRWEKALSNRREEASEDAHSRNIRHEKQRYKRTPPDDSVAGRGKKSGPFMGLISAGGGKEGTLPSFFQSVHKRGKEILRLLSQP